METVEISISKKEKAKKTNFFALLDCFDHNFHFDSKNSEKEKWEERSIKFGPLFYYKFS